jgi:hypothetical protein
MIDYTQNFKPRFNAQLRGFLKGLRISTHHIRDATGKPKFQYKTISGVGSQGAREASFFEDDQKTKTTVLTYFLKSISLRLLSIPASLSGTF